jgi:hypothetical protein
VLVLFLLCKKRTRPVFILFCFKINQGTKRKKNGRALFLHFFIFYFKIYKEFIQAFSSVGRAAALQAAGHRFESGRAYFISIFFIYFLLKK